MPPSVKRSMLRRLTANLIGTHVLPRTAWVTDLGRLADAVFPVLAVVLGALALPHPNFYFEHPPGEGYRFQANAGSCGIPRASSPLPDKMPG
jgi:hypothetical protein